MANNAYDLQIITHVKLFSNLKLNARRYIKVTTLRWPIWHGSIYRYWTDRHITITHYYMQGKYSI